MGQQPRANLEVESGGGNCFRVSHPYSNSPQKSVHFEYRHMRQKNNFPPFGKQKTKLPAPSAPHFPTSVPKHMSLSPLVTLRLSLSDG